MESLVCKLIAEAPNNWKEILTDKHIKIVEDKESPNFVLLKYSIDADFCDPVVRESRGIIINLTTLEPVCRPFDKFGNYGESYVPSIDWSSAKVQDKMDGSIIKMWYCGSHWKISTNGSIDAFETCNSEGLNFGNAFMEAALKQNPSLFQNDTPLNKEYTYMFELVGPDNQIVVQYNESEIYHIGTRHNLTGEEINQDIGIKKPREYSLSSLAECIEFANTFSGSEHEGFVVVDSKWNRIKVKGEDYVRLHYMASNSVLSIEKAIDIVYDGEIEEYCTYFPNKKTRLEEVRIKMSEELSSIMLTLQEWEKAAETLSRKEFALSYKDHPYFSFGIQTLYCGKALEIPRKYWYNYFKKGN